MLLSAIEILYLAVVWLFIIVWIGLLWKTRLTPFPLFRKPDDFDLPFEEVYFRSIDGIELSGWVMAQSAPAELEREQILAASVSSYPWIILCHGLETHRSDLLELAHDLFAEGFNLFIFDFRAHGESGGRQTSFGWTERMDLMGALAYLSGDQSIPARPYGVVGFSMGGAVALLTAAEDDRIGAVVSDGCYKDMQTAFGLWLERRRWGLLKWVLVPFWSLAYRLQFGIWPRNVDAVAACQSDRFAKFFIGGARDGICPPTQVQQLYDAAMGPKQIWIHETADHTQAFQIDRRQYVARIKEFFLANL